MTTITEARARLELYVRTGRQSFGHAADITLILGALDEAVREMHARELHLFEEEQKSAAQTGTYLSIEGTEAIIDTAWMPVEREG